jgi:hypothetical protein
MKSLLRFVLVTFVLFGGIWGNASSLMAQDFKWGPLQKGKRGIVVNTIISHSPQHTVVTKGYGISGPNVAMIKPIFERLDGGFASELIHKVDPQMDGKSLLVDFTFESNGQIYVFFSFGDRELGKRTLFVQRLDASTLQLTGAPQQIAELTFARQRHRGSFSYTFSRDSSHIAIYANSESRKDEPEKYGLFVFDQDITPLWHREVTLPYAESLFGIQDFTIDNDGNVFLLGIKSQEKRESKRKGKPNYEYRILGYHEDGTEADEYEVSLGDKFLTDMKIDVSPKKDIVCAGFYSEVGTFSVKGSYYLRIGRKSKEVERVSSKEFGIDFITQNYTERQENKAKKRAAKGKAVELYEYDLRDIIPRADGGAVLLAEQYYVTVFCRTDSRTGVTTCTNYYHYNDVIIVSIDRDGQIEWASKVPKRQTSINDGGYYSSYVSMITNENLYLVYNDNLHNLDPTLKQGQYYNFTLRDKDGIVVLATIDHEGNISRKALFPNTVIGAITIPKLCKQVNKNELLMYAKLRKESQFGLVTF